MKKSISLIAVLALLLTMVTPMALAEEVEYIPAPYAIDAELAGPTEYLDPVYYENENGPTIGVTLVGVIKVDGLYFKDSNNNQELDPFEDWRLPTEERAADLVGKMTVAQRIGLLANQLVCSPNIVSGADAYNEDGTVNFAALMNITENPLAAVAEESTSQVLEGGFTGGAAAMASMDPSERPNSTGEMLANENRSGVVRSTTDVEAGALWNNATNMVAEYAAVAKNEPTIPFFIISNPQGIVNAPASEGRAAAVTGATPEEDDFSLIERYAELDRQLWYARGMDGMYGPQIDLITDPRWPRNFETHTEIPEVNAGIAAALVKGYMDGQGEGSVSLTIKHFPGDCASLNGFESHNKYGEWRVYMTEGSLEQYHLVGFQAAIDAGLTGIMPGYSRPSATLNAPQSYRGVEIEPEEIANAYSTPILQTLLRDTMGFDGYINTDSGIVAMGMMFGAEEMSVPERIAAVVNAGSDIVGDWFGGVDYPAIWEAYESGLIEPEAFDRATTNRVSIMFDQGQFENPYRDAAAGKALQEELNAGAIAELGAEMHHKSVVLLKNHDNVLPLTDTSKKVYVASFTVEDEDEAKIEAFQSAFEAAGFEIVDDVDEADIAFLDVVPGGIGQGTRYMATLDLVEDFETADYEPTAPITEAKTGDTIEVTTLANVKGIAKIADKVHENGGIVIASINITNPWILTNLEPYCDGLIGSFSTSVGARVDVLTGAFNPTGHLPLTMVSCNEVIATVETEIDGAVYDICVAPNDVPGYDKDQYISEDVLANLPEGQTGYAYTDADGNVYAARFGLSY